MTMPIVVLCGSRPACAIALSRVLALCLLTAACAAPAAKPSVDASDPTARVPAASYRPVLDGYSSQRPAEPAPWREQNQRVTPAPKTKE
jgi:hypothetical protein